MHADSRRIAGPWILKVCNPFFIAGNFKNPGDIVFRTLSGVLFMDRKNDMAFTVNNRVLVISEHQSTINGKSRDEVIIQAMKYCEQEGIMAEFLREHGTEAVNMLFTEFNVEDALEVRFGEGQQQGQEAMLKLVNAMIADGRSEEIVWLQQDLELGKEMFAQYHINDI